MIKFLLLLAVPFSLFASQILSYNVYERTDRADVMITFDTPYNGQIKKSVSQSKIIIKLEDATIESPKIKQVSSKYLHSITITPVNHETLIVASVSPSTKFIASKTSDAYGLRLRFSNKVSVQQTTPHVQTSTTSFRLPTKKSDNLSKSYYIVVSILVIGIFILFYIKRKMKNVPVKKAAQSNWLFKNTQEQSPTSTTNHNIPNNVSIRFQKSINNENSVVMLDFGDQSYLVLMGKCNILLDKFTQNKPETQQEFDQILQNKHEDLENFLSNTVKKETQEPLQAYKERAANIAYES